MSVNDSFLYNCVERFRNIVDDPGGKYDDDYILRHFVSPAVSQVFTYLTYTSPNPVVVRHSLTLVDGQEYYQLPRATQYLRIAKLDTESRVKRDLYPHNEFNPLGPTYAIEDYMLRVQPVPAQDDDEWTLFYIPHSDARYHYATGGSLDSTRTVFTLAGSPTLGEFDREEGAYVGCKLRLFPASGGVIESRVIAAYDPVNRTVTVRRPFDVATDANTDSSSSSDNLENWTYEVVPVWPTQAMALAVAAKAALYASIGLGLSQSRQGTIGLVYRDGIKTLGDSLMLKDGRVGGTFARSTSDNADLFGPQWGYGV